MASWRLVSGPRSEPLDQRQCVFSTGDLRLLDPERIPVGQGFRLWLSWPACPGREDAGGDGAALLLVREGTADAACWVGRWRGSFEVECEPVGAIAAT